MLQQTQPLLSDFSRITSEIIGFLPEIGAALLLLLAGWILARLLRALVVRSAGLFGRLLQRIGLARRAESGRLKDATVRTIGEIVFWLVVLFFLAAATSVLGLQMFANWLDQVVGYLPQIISGLLIIFAGVVLSNIARDGALAAFASANAQQRTFIARGAQVFTLGLLVVVGLDQIGIDITVVVTVFAIVLGSVLGGLAIAFSLGARVFVSNLIGVHYLSPDYRIGVRIGIDGAVGTIVEITRIAVVLETDEGRLTVPARLFSEQASVVFTKEQDDAAGS